MPGGAGLGLQAGFDRMMGHLAPASARPSWASIRPRRAERSPPTRVFSPFQAARLHRPKIIHCWGIPTMLTGRPRTRLGRSELLWRRPQGTFFHLRFMLSSANNPSSSSNRSDCLSTGRKARQPDFPLPVPLEADIGRSPGLKQVSSLAARRKTKIDITVIARRIVPAVRSAIRQPRV